MILKKIDHIGIAVNSIEESMKLYSAMGNGVNHIEEVASQKVRTAFIKIGDVNIELLEPTSPESPIAKFLDKKGEGMHHVAYLVEDINTALHMLNEQGTRLINETPVDGAHNMLVAFIHPKSASGVLTELCQPKHTA